MISVKVLRAAGLTPDQIIRVLEAEQAEQAALVREQSRIRQRNHRARNGVTRDQRDKRDTPELGEKPQANYSPTRLEQEKQLFDRGKAICGQGAGGLIVNLLRAKEGDLALARAAIETASTKSNPREYLGGVIKAAGNPGAPNGQYRSTPPDPHSQEGRRQRTSRALAQLDHAARRSGPDDTPTFDGLWSDDKGSAGS